MTQSEKQTYLIDGEARTEEQVRALFGSGTDDPEKLDDRDRIALRMVGDAAPVTLLDVGCYSGSFLALVQKAHPPIQVHGVDYYADNVRIARLLHPEMADRLKQMSVYDLKFETESVDCVTFKEVIEHVDRPVDAVREINRVLRVGGYLILTTPNANADAWRLLLSGVRRCFRRFRGRASDPGNLIFFENIEWNRHICAWTPITLNTLLISNGFEYVDHSFYCYSLMQRLFPEMGEGLAFLVRKRKAAPQTIV